MERRWKEECMDFDKIGKYLCFILRHHPEKIGITLDEHGWADVDELLAGISERCPLCREQLKKLFVQMRKVAIRSVQTGS